MTSENSLKFFSFALLTIRFNGRILKMSHGTAGTQKHMTNLQYLNNQRMTRKEVYTDLADEIRRNKLQSVEEVLELIEAHKKELSQPAKQV